ncbi:hypothetical protein PAXINDRAFT_11808 [Paxillus involutus ATCC 200175]|uniref:DUF6532 domain-containing protein n=1 Tax=Paxillus involutus ATCC 200175 TaxID=664439 RepID=A0A0C9TY96_PAXIN|nr:hypothetical protein PAXINDRAFT_11808 [Paxillus involutus ATCC 200175]
MICRCYATIKWFPDRVTLVNTLGSEFMEQAIAEYEENGGVLQMSLYHNYHYEMKIWLYKDLSDFRSHIKKVACKALLEAFNIKPTEASSPDEVAAHVKACYNELWADSKFLHSENPDGTLENFRGQALTQTCVRAFYMGKTALAPACKEYFSKRLPSGAHVLGAVAEYESGIYQAKDLSFEDFTEMHEELTGLYEQLKATSEHEPILRNRCKQIAMLGW